MLQLKKLRLQEKIIFKSIELGQCQELVFLATVLPKKKDKAKIAPFVN